MLEAYLWHGNVKKAADKLDYCYCIFDDEDLHYSNRLEFQKMTVEMLTYIGNNQHLIPNYEEKYRYGETISTAFVESTVNDGRGQTDGKKTADVVVTAMSSLLTSDPNGSAEC